MDYDSKIYVAGHRGLVGSAIVRMLKRKGYRNIITKTHKQLDLTDQAQTEKFFLKKKPEYVFLAAAKVGGIRANNDYPADFILENELIQCNVIRSSYKSKVKKLMFLGSACIYPRDCMQPIKEEYLLTRPLEPTNEPYALAKISGLRMCQYFNRQYGTNYIGVVPAGVYGPRDDFYSDDSHVIPALLRKMHEARAENRAEVGIWGTGSPVREFIFADDMADACVFLMETYNSSEFINIGTGEEISIRDLALLIRDIAGFRGRLVFDADKPDGMPKKVLDVSRLVKTGWKPRTELKDGIRQTYDYYRKLKK